MSGLTTFFKEFLPGKNVAEQDYTKSLESLNRSERGTSSDDEAVAPDSTYRTSNVEYTPIPWDFKRWQHFCRDSMQTYFLKRLGGEDDDSYESDDHLDDEGQSASQPAGPIEEGDDDEETEQWETQQQNPGPAQESNDQCQDQSGINTENTNLEQQHLRRRFPPMSTAIHEVQTLQHLDLYTSALTLNLCRVVRIWRYRETKRPLAWSTTNRGKRLCPVLPGRLPRVMFSHKEEDGPCSTIYKQVLSLEVEQIGCKSPRNRMRVFLYGGYARAMRGWLEGSPSTNKPTNFVLCLSKIPALCILPYALDHGDWLDQARMIDYCVCLGDTSTMRVRSGPFQDDIVFLRLDSEELELRVATTTMAAQNGQQDFVLSRKGLENEKQDRPNDSPSRLCEAWREHQKTLEEASEAKALEGPSEETDEQTKPVSTPATASVDPESSRPVEPARPAQEPQRDTATGNAAGQQDETSRPPRRPPEPMVFEGPARKRPKNAQTAKTACVTLTDLKGIYQSLGRDAVVDIFAVVVGFTAASQTKRGDWMMTASLVDATCQVPVSLVAFCARADQLPNIIRMGDVLRMHRVSLQEWKEDIQLQGRRMSSYVVIRRHAIPQSPPRENTTAHPDLHWVAVPSSNKLFTFDEDDEERSQSLWKWGDELLKAQPTINVEHRFLLGDMACLLPEDENEVSDKDMTVMVSAKFPYPEDDRTGITPFGFIRVWDGTGAAPSDPLPILTMPARQTQEKGDPPPEALDKIASVIQRINASGRSELVMETPKALCGKVCNVVIWEEAQWKLVTEHVKLGTFVRLRNVRAQPWKHNTFRSLFVHSKSWLTPLPDENYEVRQLLEAHDQRVHRNDFNPTSGLLSVLPGPSLGHNRATGLGSGLAAFVSTTPNGLYEGAVQFSATVPKYEGNLQALCHGSRSCAGFEYRFVVRLADESTSIDALVDNAAGEKLVGMSASEAAKVRNREAAFDADKAWTAKIQSVKVQGRRYFVLLGVSEMVGQ